VTRARLRNRRGASQVKAHKKCKAHTRRSTPKSSASDDTAETANSASRRQSGDRAGDSQRGRDSGRDRATQGGAGPRRPRGCARSRTNSGRRVLLHRARQNVR
jgi:hypothetical protein